MSPKFRVRRRHWFDNPIICAYSSEYHRRPLAALLGAYVHRDCGPVIYNVLAR